VRIDAGVQEGDDISPFYDPMIAKLIWRGEKRELAALNLCAALRQVEIWPVKHNAQFVADLLGTPAFVRGRVHTGFIEEHGDFEHLIAEPGRWDCNVAAERLVDRFDRGGPLGFRLNAPAQSVVRLRVDGKSYEGDFTRSVNPAFRLSMQVEEADDGGLYISMFGSTLKYGVDETRGSATAFTSSGAILAPMPGRIIAVEVSEGQAVTKGQKLVTLEAMKMEHSLTAPFDGTVSELKVTQGDQVQLEALLVRIEPAPET
jgi:3-methylcrotonyl-CoA carboxylase alpha subunit